jgi:hypothetical protein
VLPATAKNGPHRRRRAALLSMAWGRRTAGAKPDVDDIVARIADSSTEAFVMLPFRSLDEAGALRLAEAVRTAPSLKSLSVTNKAIGSKGCAALAEAAAMNPVVVELSLGWPKLGDEGASAIAVELLRASSAGGFVHRLELDACGIGEDGAERLARLMEHGSLRRLVLSRNPLGARGCSTLLEAGLRGGLHSLDLSGCCEAASYEGGSVPSLLRGIPDDSPMRELRLGHCALVGDDSDTTLALLERLLSLPRLEVLDLSRCGLSPREMRALGAGLRGRSAAHGSTPFHQVFRLVLDGNSLGDEGVTILTSELLEHGSAPHGLGLALSLAECGVGDAGATHLGGLWARNGAGCGRVALRSVEASRNDAIGSEGCIALLAGAGSSNGQVQLLGCKALASADVAAKERVVAAAVEALHSMMTATDAVSDGDLRLPASPVGFRGPGVDLGLCGLTDEHCEALMRALRESPGAASASSSPAPGKPLVWLSLLGNDSSSRSKEALEALPSWIRVYGVE